VSHFSRSFRVNVETGVPGGKPLKRKSLFLFFFVICVFSTSFLWVETGVPGVKPPSQIPASRGRCLGFESDGRLFVHLADWALNTSSPEGLKAVRQAAAAVQDEDEAAAVVADEKPTGPEQELTRGRDGTNRIEETCAFVTDPLLTTNPSKPTTPVPDGLRSFFRYQSS